MHTWDVTDHLLVAAQHAETPVIVLTLSGHYGLHTTHRL